MNAMSLMVSLGIDLKQLKNDLAKAQRVIKEFSKKSDVGEIGVEFSVDVDGFENDIDDIIRLAHGADVSIDGSANIDISDYVSGIQDVENSAKKANENADVDADADIDTSVFNDNIDGIIDVATNANDEASVESDADIDTTDFNSSIDDIIAAAESADDDASVESEADIDISDYESGISDIEGLAGSAEADVDSEASLDISEYENGIDDLIGAAATAEKDASIEATATLTVDSDPIDDAIEKAEQLQEALGGVETGAGNADSALNNIGKQVSLQNVISGLGSIESGLTNIINKAIEAGKAIADMAVDASVWADDLKTEAEQFNLDTTVIQQMRYASQFIDTEVGTIETALQRLTKNINEANEGSKETAESFEKLGVKIKDADGNVRPAIEVFWDVVDALGGIENQTERDGAAMELLGRNIADLNPLINAGTEAYKEMMEQAGVLTEDQVAALGTLNDKYNEVTSKAETLKLQIMSELAPAFVEATDKIGDFIAKIGEFTQTETGQEAIGKLRDAITKLVETLTDEKNIESLINTITGAVETLTKALDWFADNPNVIATGIKTVLGAFATIKVSSGVLKIIELINGLKGLGLGAGAAGGSGGALASGVSGVTAAASGMLLPAAYAGAGVVGGAYLLHNLATERERTYGEYFNATEGIEDAQTALSSYQQTLDESKTSLQAFVDNSIVGADMLGQTGDEVAQIQQMLVDAGHDIGEKGVDGIFGKDTAAAWDEYIANTKAEAEDAIRSITQEQDWSNTISSILSEAFAISEGDDTKEQAAAFIDKWKTGLEEAFPEGLTVIDTLKERMAELGLEFENFNFSEALEKAMNGDQLMAQLFNFDGWDTFTEDIVTQMVNALNGSSEKSDLLSNIVGDGTEITQLVEEVAASTGEEVGTEIEAGITSGSTTGANAMETEIEAAIDEASAIVEQALDEAISKERELPIRLGVTGGGNYSALLDINGYKHATAMTNGEILRGMTPFGMGADGSLHFGGEAGAEAVVGVNSLDRMIQESVNNAIGAVIGRMDTLIGEQRNGDVVLNINGREFARATAGDMNRELGAMSKLRGGGRA